jgi:hypothetical protein
MTMEVSAWEGGPLGRPLDPAAICLSEEEIRQAASKVHPAEDPELGWMRYLRSLAIVALSSWLKPREVAVVIGPQLEPEAPGRLLALNGFATQLLCITPQVQTVKVPLIHWRNTATAPQLLLLAQVDEDHGMVQFLGVMDATTFVIEVRRFKEEDQMAMTLPLGCFGGGAERLLRWITLLEPKALPRRGIGLEITTNSKLKKQLASWVDFLLASNSCLVPVTLSVQARRGISLNEINALERGKDEKSQGIHLLSPLAYPSESGELIAHSACVRPSIWSNTPLAEIQIWRDSDLIWRQQATVDAPICGPISWPLKDLDVNDRLTIYLRPYGFKTGDQAAFTLIAGDPHHTQLNEEAINNSIRHGSVLFIKTMQENKHHEILAEFMARVVRSLASGEMIGD